MAQTMYAPMNKWIKKKHTTVFKKLIHNPKVKKNFKWHERIYFTKEEIKYKKFQWKKREWGL
jgi:hypothetical protein